MKLKVSIHPLWTECFFLSSSIFMLCLSNTNLCFITQFYYYIIIITYHYYYYYTIMNIGSLQVEEHVVSSR